MTIYIIHPEKPVREALQATLSGIHADIQAAENAPASTDGKTVFLAQNGGDLPAEQTIILNGQNLKTLLREIEGKFRTLSSPRILDLGTAQLDTATRDFTAAEKSVSLTEKESAILIYLAQKKEPVTRDDLLRDVWNYAADVDTHTIETHIYRLRQKIETDPEKPKILLTRKDGYQLAAISKA
jgi:hypothetical protein